MREKILLPGEHMEVKFVRQKWCYGDAMTLKHLSDIDLLTVTKNAAKKERAITTEVLRHLQEMERRRLFADLGFSSLFDYAVTEMHYSEDQALRRISAMCLLKELPKIEEKIKDGSLTLTNLSKAQTYFRHKKKSAKVTPEEKLALLEKLENKSSREAEKILLALDPMSPRTDRVKAVSEENVEICFTAPAALLEKINELKALLAHSHPNANLAELFALTVDLGIAHHRKRRSHETPEKFAPPAAPKVKPPGLNERYVPAQLKREIWSQEKCENCGGTFALEIDHRIPYAKGGHTSSENLRILCRSCNQRAAIVTFGEVKMGEFLQ